MFAGMDFGQIGLVMSRHDIERRLVTARPALADHLMPESTLPGGVVFEFPGGERVGVVWMQLDSSTAGWTVGVGADTQSFRQNMCQSVDEVVERALTVLDERLAAHSAS